MTKLKYKLRRSPRRLLRREGYPGPGPGNLALVMSRAGVGKTALLVGIGLDALLAGQKVLHLSVQRPVNKVRKWYDDLLTEMLRREHKLEHWASIQLAVERDRHIQTYLGQSFSIDRLRQSMDLMVDAMEFEPQVIIFDRPELEGIERDVIEGLRELAAKVGAELWMACRTHRAGPAEPGHLAPPADVFEDLVDLGLSLDPYKAKIRLHVIKDRQEIQHEALNILLDPQTLLLVSGISARR